MNKTKASIINESDIKTPGYVLETKCEKVILTKEESLGQIRSIYQNVLKMKRILDDNPGFKGRNQVCDEFKEFKKTHPKIFKMTLDGMNLELLEKVLSITHNLNIGKITDEEASKEFAVELAREYFPKDVLEKEGLL